MKVDLHTHASERSECSNMTEEELVQAAMAADLDGVAITDHGRLIPASRVRQLNDQFAPMQVFGGIEIECDEEHMLVFGVGDPVLEQRDWHYSDLHAFVGKRKGFLALAHPFRFHEILIDIERYPPNALEVRSNNISDSTEPRIRSLATRLRLPLLCSSDAHGTDRIGRHHTVLHGDATSDTELVEILRAGRFSLPGETD